MTVDETANYLDHNTGYYVFAGESWYPFGGFQDLVGVYPTVDEAMAAADASDRSQWAHVVEINGMSFEVVAVAQDRVWSEDRESFGWLGWVPLGDAA